MTVDEEKQQVEETTTASAQSETDNDDDQTLTTDIQLQTTNAVYSRWTTAVNSTLLVIVLPLLVAGFANGNDFSMEVALGIEITSLSFHMIGGLIAVFGLLAQVFTGTSMSRNRSSDANNDQDSPKQDVRRRQYRMAHVIVGWVLFALLAAVGLTGVYIALAYWDDYGYIYTSPITSVPGIIILLLLIAGIVTVKIKRNIPLHKDIMVTFMIYLCTKVGIFKWLGMMLATTTVDGCYGPVPSAVASIISFLIVYPSVWLGAFWKAGRLSGVWKVVMLMILPALLPVIIGNAAVFSYYGTTVDWNTCPDYFGGGAPN